jgi:hypothetical protein
LFVLFWAPFFFPDASANAWKGSRNRPFFKLRVPVGIGLKSLQLTGSDDSAEGAGTGKPGASG